MGEYDSWFLSKLTDLMNAVVSANQNTIIEAYNEVQRGIEYANTNTGSIQDLLVRMGQGLIGPVIVQYKLEKKSSGKKEHFELSELQSVLKQKQHEKVVDKMTGSLTSLMDHEDEK